MLLSDSKSPRTEGEQLHQVHAVCLRHSESLGRTRDIAALQKERGFDSRFVFGERYRHEREVYY